MGAKVSGLQLHGESGAKTAACAESGDPVQSESPGSDATDTGRERGEDGRGVGPLPSRLDWLFRSMSDAFGAARSGGVDQAQATVCDLEAVGSGTGSIRRIAETRSGQRSRRPNGGQRSRPVEAGGLSGTSFRAAQCLLRLARDSAIDCRTVAQPAEPPDADPHVRWCDRESWRQPTYVDFYGYFLPWFAGCDCAAKLPAGKVPVTNANGL